MKTRMKAVAVLLVFVCLLSCLSILSGGAAADSTSSTDEEVRYTKKIVSVLYDNSGSMTKTDNGTSVAREEYAIYSMQMLMSLLGPDDELIITPLNRPGSTSAIDSIDYGVDVEESTQQTGAVG